MAKRVSKDLEALKTRVVEWRSKKKRGSRIPEELWNEAVAVAQREGVSSTSRVTGFAYGDLKKRVADGVKSPKASAPPSFVAIEVPPTATTLVSRWNSPVRTVRRCGSRPTPAS